MTVSSFALLKERQVRLVCLAGFMRLLTKVFLDAFPNAVVNIHPSLLPAFPGTNAQYQAWEHGVKWTGATVHLVNDGIGRRADRAAGTCAREG